MTVPSFFRGRPVYTSTIPLTTDKRQVCLSVFPSSNYHTFAIVQIHLISCYPAVLDSRGHAN